MSKFTKNPPQYEATQWNFNGDHPLDGPAENEGAVVRYFRHPDYDGLAVCPDCGVIYHDHGWIDTDGEYAAVESDGDDEMKVCPGDWIVEGIGHQAGKYKAIPNAEFVATYTPVP